LEYFISIKNLKEEEKKQEPYKGKGRTFSIE
jgi:hypothetical protein